MELIKKDKLSLSIKNNYDYPFEISESGVYFIEIVASAKSWWQNLKSFKSFFNDDDLTLKIDAIEFPKLNKKRGLFDGEVAWNGNNLKGLLKTNIFIINLNKGSHLLNFLADKNPILESIAIFKVDEEEINYLPEENNPAQDGDRRQWMTIIPINVFIKNLNIKASAKKYPKNIDDDDIKLIINGAIQKNESDKPHQNWFWCGRILDGLEKEFNQEVNFENKLNYIELWADRMPVLSEIKLSLDFPESNIKKGKIALYEDIIEFVEYANVRSDSNTGSEIIFQLKNQNEVEIIKEVETGENIQNYSNIWHKIRYKDMEGYILSSFVEIEGQEREKIVEKIRTQAKSRGIDENYAIALAGCESRYKPYAVSFSGALGIFQLTDIARDQLREKLNFEISEKESYNPDKNIEAGIVYLKWLFRVYKGATDEYKKVTAAWNAGGSLIPIEGAISFDKIIDPAKRKEVQDLVDRVEKNRKRKNWNFILFSLILIGIFSISAGLYSTGEKEFAAGKVLAAHNSREEIRYSDTKFKFDNPYPEIKSIVVSGESPRPTEWYTNVVIEYKDGRIDKKRYSGFLDNAYMFNIISFTRELVIARQEGKQILTSILAYDQENESLEDIKFIHLDGRESGDLCCSYIILKPFANGVQYDVAVLNLMGNRDSVYKYNFSNSAENAFVEVITW
ncbi:MAG: transglycosylase SLT domain-containing protein [Parcubacteria group bacterium]